jgi:hypothetical protein
MSRVKKQIASKQRYYGKRFPSVISKIEKFKKIKKSGDHIPEKLKLTDIEDELLSWIGTAKFHQKELGKITSYLFS